MGSKYEFTGKENNIANLLYPIMKIQNKRGLGIVTEFVQRRRTNQVSHPCSQSRLGSQGWTSVGVRVLVRMGQLMQPPWEMYCLIQTAGAEISRVRGPNLQVTMPGTPRGW